MFTLHLQTTVGQAVVEAPTVRYTYQTSMADANTTTTNVTLLKTEDSTQTEYHKDHHLCHTVSVLNYAYMLCCQAERTGEYVTDLGNKYEILEDKKQSHLKELMYSRNK